jgi:hypothetical protein
VFREPAPGSPTSQLWQLLDDLGSAKDSPARILFNAGTEAERVSGVKGLLAYDRIFGMLEREFEPAEVRRAVAMSLYAFVVAALLNLSIAADVMADAGCEQDELFRAD